MSIVIPDAAERILLDWMLKATSTPESLSLRLYANNYTPTSASAASDMVEATFTGYSAQPLARASWGDAQTVGGIGVSTYGSTLTWTAGSAQTIYGYYILGSTSGSLILAERFDTPRNVINGEQLTIQPALKLNTGSF